MARPFLLAAVALGGVLAGCGSSSSGGLGYGSGALYFVVGAGQAGAPTGMNCPPAQSAMCTLNNLPMGTCSETTNEAQRTYWSIYPAANGEALLQGALTGTDQLVGKVSGSTYTFSGSVVASSQDPSGNTLSNETDTTVTLTVTSGAFTGSFTTENKTSCSGSGCTGFSAEDCTQSTSVAGSEISVQEFNTSVGAQSNNQPTCATVVCAGQCCPAATPSCVMGACM